MIVLLMLINVETPQITPSTDGYSSSLNACIVHGLKCSMNLTVNVQRRLSLLMVLTRQRGNGWLLSLQVARHPSSRYRLVK